MNNEDVNERLLKYFLKQNGTLPKRKSYFDLLEEKRNQSTILRREDILSMIDIALMTGDKEWFMELTSKLESVAV